MEWLKNRIREIEYDNRFLNNIIQNEIITKNWRIKTALQSSNNFQNRSNLESHSMHEISFHIEI